VLVLKQHPRNILVATRVYLNCYTEIFQGLRACTETAVLKYFSVYPCVLKLHCTTEIFQCVPVCTAIALLKYFSVNRSVLKYFNAYNYLLNLQY